MLATLLIVFREILEAGLIVGIVLAATQGVAGRARWIAGGIGAGVTGAALLAAFAGYMSAALSGNGREVFNATILILAVGMLAWHILWMASHGRDMARQMKAMGRDVASGDKSLAAMAVVVAVAVMREGSEVVLFLYGIAASGQSSLGTMLLGGALGIAAGGAVSFLLYRGLLAIPVGRLFSVTSGLIALLAAGMAGQAAAILAGIDAIPAWGWQIWDTSGVLPEDSLIGRSLHALIGYSDRPMGIQLMAYSITLFTLLSADRLINRRPARRVAAQH